MKKIFYSMIALLMAFSFTSCEDVPAPYSLEDDESENVPGQEDILLKETFATSLGSFTNYTTSGEGTWKIDYGTAKASGYDFESKVNTAGIYYLVSPEVSLAGQTEVHLSYEYILAYKSRVPNGNKLLITANFDEDNADQNWTEIDIEHVEAGRTEEGKVDWKTFNTIDVQIPEEFLGQNIRFAFYHECTTSGSTTMEIKNVVLAVGKAGEEGGNENPEAEDGVRSLPYGESFAADFGGFKNYTTSGEGEWKIDFNTAKATGYDFANKTNTAGTYYLVSPEISLAGQNEVHFTYEYIQAYANKLPEGNKLFITDNFNPENAAANWTELPVKHKEPNKNNEGKIDWKSFHKMDVQVPSQFLGKNIRIAFYHECNAQSSTTMEIRNFLIEAGKAQGGDTPEPQPEGGALVEETFASSFGVFTENTIKGQPWIIDFKTAKASGYDNGSKTTTASDSYLVSPAMDMSSLKEANVKFEYILRYVSFNGTPTPGVVNELLITNNYTGDPATTQWTDITGKLKEGKDWTTFEKFGVNIPAEFVGQNKVVIALHYACEEKSGTWEVKNLKVSEGKAEDNPGGGDQPGGGDTPDVGDTTTSNGDFETWVDGQPNNWDGPASKANLFQSTDAHSGKYSVQVGGSDQNMRLGYKTLNLKAGHYVMKFFVKAVTAEGGTARAGYVVLTNGKPTGGNDYIYGDYINDLKNNEWREVTYEFDINADGEYTVVVMNAKKPGKDILVDDFTLECNGKFIIK